MSARTRFAILAALLAASAAGCGQQGPLVLPPEARPVERVGPAAADPEPADDEGQDER